MSNAESTPGKPTTMAQMAAQGIRSPGSSTTPPPPPPPPPPPSVATTLNQLAKYLSRPTVRGLYYNHKLINLDGYEFVECRFDNCALIVNSTNFEIINCVIDPLTSIQFGKETLKVVQLNNRNNEWMRATGSHFAPKQNPDGTISITGIAP